MGLPSLAGEGRDKNSRTGGSECWGVPVSSTEKESSGRSLTSSPRPGPEGVRPRPVPPAAGWCAAGQRSRLLEGQMLRSLGPSHPSPQAVITHSLFPAPSSVL